MRLWLRSLFAVRPLSLTLGTIVLVALVSELRLQLLETAELKSYDLRVRARGARRPSGDVLLAAIDEKSLDAEGRWPWPRSKIAALVTALSRDGARVIAFDVSFAEPDSPEHDRALASAIETSPARIVLGYFIHLRESDAGFSIGRDDVESRVRRIGASRYKLIASREPDLARVPFIKAHAPQPNVDLLTDAAASSGHFSFVSDPDGLLRWAPLAIEVGGAVFPSLSVVAAWEYLGRPAMVLQADRYGVDSIDLGDRIIPTNERGQLLIDYLGPPKTFRHVPVTDILHGRVSGGTFQGKIVLVGATAVGTYDVRSTPYGVVYPGVEIHASVIDNILTRRLLDRPTWWRVFDLLAIVLLASSIAILWRRSGALKGVLLYLALFGAYVLFSVWLFSRFGVWLSVVYPLLALSTNYTALTAFRYVGEERERRKTKQTFLQYVAPEVVEEMLKNPQQLKLGGEQKVLTVLFSDFEGFTTLSEKYPPHQILEMLSEYYGQMTEEVFAHRGTLKEYVGDELMAFYGAPLEQADHAERACATALAMRERRLALSDDWARRGRPRFRARTGINSGPMLVGNLGSRYRFAYGVLGDQVNLGSRLEGLNRVFGTDILLGENTEALARESFLFREIDVVRVKGKVSPVRVYELLGHKRDGLQPDHAEAVALYEAALVAYRERRWQEALRQFEEASRCWPLDQASRTMAERCRAYLKAPPPEDWNGVFVQTLLSLKGSDV